MKRESYNNIISMLADPATTAEGIEALNKQLLIDEEEYTSLDNKNRDLIMKNNQLVLSQVQQSNIVPEKKEHTEEEQFKSLFTDHFHLLNND